MLLLTSTDLKQSRPDARLLAEGLVEQMQQLDTVLMTIIWHTILERFNATNLSLQNSDIDLLSVVKMYDTLNTFLISNSGHIIRDVRED